MKNQTITCIKEDVLSLGQMVGRTLDETIRLINHSSDKALGVVEEQEELINRSCQDIEDKCMGLLLEKATLSPQEIRSLVGSTIIAAKFERLADHAYRVAKIASWAHEDKIEIPAELLEMACVVERMMQDVLLAFLTNATDKAQEIVQRDSRVDYLDDALSKRLLSDLGQQESAQAQMRAQFLFGARFLERMGDACASIAKRVYFISTGQRLKVEE